MQQVRKGGSATLLQEEEGEASTEKESSGGRGGSFPLPNIFTGRPCDRESFPLLERNWKSSRFFHKLYQGLGP